MTIYKTIYSNLILIFLLIFLFVIYFKTALPSVGFHDVGDLQTSVALLDIPHPTGFPTYVLLGKLLISIFPVGEIAWRVNILSAVYSLGALLFLGLFIRSFTKDKYFYLIGITVLGLSKDFWNYAGIADTHSLSRVFLSILLFVFLILVKKLTSKNVFLFSLLLGLGLGNHLFLLYSLPGFFIWFLILLINRKLQIELKMILISFLGFFLGISVYLFLPLRTYFGSPFSPVRNFLDLSYFINYTSGSSFHGLMYQGGVMVIASKMVEGLSYLREAIYLPGVLLGLLGILYGLKKYSVISLSLLVMFFSFLAFSTNYPTSDPTRYYLSFILVYSIFVSLGAIFIKQVIFKYMRRFFILKRLLNIIFIFFILYFVNNLFISNYHLVDKSNSYQAADYTQEIFTKLPQNSVIISWWNYTTPLRYRKYVLNQRNDLLIIIASQNEWLDYVNKYIGLKDIYLVDREQRVEQHYKVESFSKVYHVLP